MIAVRRSLVLVLALALLAAAVPAAHAASVLVDFETGEAPCGFAETTALQTLPGAPGLAFQGPQARHGGGLLGGCAGFGVAPRSGDAFLAFNRGGRFSDDGRATDPETLLFSGGASRVSIWASGGHASTSFLLEAFDGDGSLLGSAITTAAAGAWSLLEIAAPEIASVRLHETGGDNSFVFDDLSWDGLPEPGTGPLIVLALAAAGGARPRR